uniref:Ig-like domain-containing protein n=1 Tax=Periophthalmus magnuspinnatus TaxID=409849 RepID=A0A3B4AIJ0_9GOBI
MANKTTLRSTFCYCSNKSSAFGHKNLTVGGNITLSCSNISKTTTQVDWFRVENGTKACCISSLYGYNCEPSYCSGFKHRRFQMSANVTDVFLTIYEVKTSDSGLYFCGFFIKSNIVLGEATYLSVEGKVICSHCDFLKRSMLYLTVFSHLKDIFESMSIIPTLTLDRSEEVNYAAVNIKATKRPQMHRQMEPHVIYSSTR